MAVLFGVLVGCGSPEEDAKPVANSKETVSPAPAPGPSEPAVGTEPQALPEPTVSETGVTIAIPDGGSGSTGTITPMDVIGAGGGGTVAAPANPDGSLATSTSPPAVSSGPPSAPPGAGGPPEGAAALAVPSLGDLDAVPEALIKGKLPPGIQVPNITSLLGESNIVLESVKVGEVRPGEGPVGPDGKVIDPETFLKERMSQGLGPPINSGLQKSPDLSSIKRLDPSEAPDPGKLPVPEPKKPE